VKERKECRVDHVSQVWREGFGIYVGATAQSALEGKMGAQVRDEGKQEPIKNTLSSAMLRSLGFYSICTTAS
jgi:hypothetical protein